MTKADKLIALTEAEVVLLTAHDTLMRMVEYFRAVIDGADSIIDKLQRQVSDEVHERNVELDAMEGEQ